MITLTKAEHEDEHAINHKLSETRIFFKTQHYLHQHYQKWKNTFDPNEYSDPHLVIPSLYGAKTTPKPASKSINIFSIKVSLSSCHQNHN